MPSIVPLQPHGMRHSSSPHGEHKPSGIVKFTNCRLLKGNELVNEDLWVSSTSGKILNGQQLLYEERVAPENIVNLQGRILSPGLIDVQLNGAFDFDFSVIPEDGVVAYGKGVSRVNRKLVATGVTSYLPTVTSQRPEVYHKVVPNALPFLGPSGSSRDPTLGSESLGAHCEGPFLNPTKNGIHNAAVLQSPNNGLRDLIACYGVTNLSPPSPSDQADSNFNRANITLVTLAPELPGALDAIAALKAHNINTSIGHTTATYEQAAQALSAGATMLTHLFNAMPPLHHRNPGPFGLLGTNTPLPSTSRDTQIQKPFFGLIADGIHLHPTTIAIAFHAHPDGLVLVTDAMRFAGMPDGTYDWTNGSRVIKQGTMLTLEENGRIAGSSIQLVDCVSNFAQWTGCGVARALRAVTETPARMLGVQDRKGVLKEGADADLVVFETEGEGAAERLVVEQVWKFGRKVFDRSGGEGGV